MQQKPNWINWIIGGSVAAVTFFCLTLASLETVPAGHVKVGRLFGQVDAQPIEEGLHLVNPLKTWVLFDCRQKTLAVMKVPVPSGDQLTSSIDFSVQYRADKSMASSMLQETGGVEAVVHTHLNPAFRSSVRQRAKGVESAEGWFDETVQSDMQANLLSDLQEVVASKGLMVTAVLIRAVRLPEFIQEAIEQKKVREQEAQKELAELERFKIEQDKLIATAESELEAANLEAQKIAVLADAIASKNRKVSGSLTSTLVEWERLQVMNQKWDGKLPQVTGGAIPLLKLE